MRGVYKYASNTKPCNCCLWMVCNSGRKTLFYIRKHWRCAWVSRDNFFKRYVGEWSTRFDWWTMDGQTRWRIASTQEKAFSEKTSQIKRNRRNLVWRPRWTSCVFKTQSWLQIFVDCHRCFFKIRLGHTTKNQDRQRDHRSFLVNSEKV